MSFRKSDIITLPEVNGFPPYKVVDVVVNFGTAIGRHSGRSKVGFAENVKLIINSLLYVNKN